MSRRRAAVRAVAATGLITLALASGTIAAGQRPSAPSALARTGSSQAGSSQPGAVLPDQFGYVVARHPTTHSYHPAAKDSDNSSGGINTITHNGAGDYTVRFGGAAFSGATAHVSALGSSPRLCTVGGLSIDLADEIVYVECFSRAGVFSDAPFILEFLGTSLLTAKLAYLWADQPLMHDYTPDIGSQHHLTGTPNTIHRSGKGSYVAHLPGLGQDRGVVLVTAHGVDPVACRAAGWHGDHGVQVVHVMCRKPGGSLVDATFHLTFLQGLSFEGAGGSIGAYLWANKALASYHPDVAHRYSSSGGTPTVTHAGTGVYSALLPGMPRGGAAIVTATGTGKVRCVVGGIRTSGSPQKIGIRCFDVGGHPANSPFDLAYAR